MVRSTTKPPRTRTRGLARSADRRNSWVSTFIRWAASANVRPPTEPFVLSMEEARTASVARAPPPP